MLAESVQTHATRPIHVAQIRQEQLAQMADRPLAPALENTATGLHLHRFGWLPDGEAGEPAETMASQNCVVVLS